MISAAFPILILEPRSSNILMYIYDILQDIHYDMYVGFYSVRPLPLLLQLLPQTPPRTGRGRRLLLPLERHARCGPSLDLHIEGLVVAHLDPARALPPPARRALLFGCSVGCRAHLHSSCRVNSAG